MTWSDQTVLVTGATSGVGRALAKALAARGAHVVVHGRDRRRLGEVAAEVGGAPVAVDLAETDGAERLAYAAREAVAEAEWPGLSVVVNNAAVQLNYRIADRDPEAVAADVAREVTVDLVAPAQLSALLLPDLREAARRPGAHAVIVNVTSGLALAPKASAPIYCAAKAGLRTFSKALRYQLEDEATAGGPVVHVVEAVLPLVDTPMTAGRESRVAKIAPEQAAAEILDAVAAGQAEVGVGKARLFRWLHRWVPGVAERMLRDG